MKPYWMAMLSCCISPTTPLEPHKTSVPTLLPLPVSLRNLHPSSLCRRRNRRSPLNPPITPHPLTHPSNLRPILEVNTQLRPLRRPRNHRCLRSGNTSLHKRPSVPSVAVIRALDERIVGRGVVDAEGNRRGEGEGGRGDGSAGGGGGDAEGAGVPSFRAVVGVFGEGEGGGLDVGATVC